MNTSIESLIYHLLCVDRHFILYKKTRNEDSDWISGLIEDLWQIIKDGDFNIDREGVDEYVQYLQEIYGNGSGLGSNLLISLIDVIYYLAEIEANDNALLPPLQCDHYLKEDLVGYLALQKFGENEIYESSSALTGQFLNSSLLEKELALENNAQKDLPTENLEVLRRKYAVDLLV